MSKFNKTGLISIFPELGQQLLHPNEQFLEIITSEYQHNAWFTPQNVLNAVTNIGRMLNSPDLTVWLNRYNLDKNKAGKKVGLILAGNIPLVGFHDVLCVLVTGNIALIKSSSNDARLIKHILQILVSIEPAFKDQFSFVERLKDFDAVIATGSNNTSRYFEYYFGKVPHIIRKNRSSIALLTGTETEEQIVALGHDIFDYYGLGCRNVSKLLLPKGYDFHLFYEPLESYQEVINHHKYSNNYSYNRSIYLVNSDEHLDNGFLLLKEDKKLASPLAVLYYEYYEDLQSAQNLLNEQSDNIQCIVSDVPLTVSNQVVGFGMSQQPPLWEYADGIDTMEFLSTING